MTVFGGIFLVLFLTIPVSMATNQDEAQSSKPHGKLPVVAGDSDSDDDIQWLRANILDGYNESGHMHHEGSGLLPNPIGSSGLVVNRFGTIRFIPNPIVSSGLTPNPIGASGLPPNPIGSSGLTPNRIGSSASNPIGSSGLTSNPIGSSGLTPNPIGSIGLGGTGKQTLTSSARVIRSRKRKNETKAETIKIKADPANFKNVVQRWTSKDSIGPEHQLKPVNYDFENQKIDYEKIPASKMPVASASGQRIYNLKHHVLASEFHNSHDHNHQLKLQQEQQEFQQWQQHQLQWEQQQQHEYDQFNHDLVQQLPQHLSQDHQHNDNDIMGVHGISSGFHQQQHRKFGTGEEIEHHHHQLRQIQPQLTQQKPQQYVQQHPMGIWGEGSSHGRDEEDKFSQVIGKQSVSGHDLHHQHVNIPQHTNIPQPKVPHAQVPRTMGIQNAGDYGIDSTGVAGQHRMQNSGGLWYRTILPPRDWDLSA